MMTKDEAKTFGAVRTARRGNQIEAVFSSVGSCARFAAEMRKRGIGYRERFANGGKAIKFIWEA